MKESLPKSAHVRDVVRAPIVQEESGCAGSLRVVECCGVVFQDVKDGEHGEEEGEPPEGGGELCEIERGGDGEAEGQA